MKRRTEPKDDDIYIEDDEIGTPVPPSIQEVNYVSNTKLSFLNRLGCPSQKISPFRLLSALQRQLNDLLNKIFDSFFLSNGTLRSINQGRLPSDESKELAKLAKDMVEVYYTAKLATLKCPPQPVEDIINIYSILIKLFENLLKNYSERGSEKLKQEDLNIIFSFGLLLSSLSHFIDEAGKTQTEPILGLLISLTSLQYLVDSFKMILPPAHQSRLFALTLYNDLTRIQTSFQVEDADQVAKLKAIIELAFIKYGDFFLSNYTEELLFTFNRADLMECPAAVWSKATHGSTTVQTELGPSFLVSMIKYQWGIIKDFNGIVPDPTNDIILFHTELEDLFDFLNDQAQHLFFLTAALHTVLEEDVNYRASFNTDAETLIKTYVELMDHLVRIVSALIDAYNVNSQSDETILERVEQLYLLQSTKFHVILLIFSLCSIQLSLTGSLHISSAPSISPVLEFYLSKSDFTAASDSFELSEEFTKTFMLKSSTFYSNYPMLKGLSKAVQLKLSGNLDKKGFSGSKISLNMLCFCILIICMLVVQSFWFVQAILAFIDDFFLY